MAVQSKMRPAMDKAHRAFVSLLGVATVASAAYFGMNAYSILSHVYNRPKAGAEQVGAGESAAK